MRKATLIVVAVVVGMAHAASAYAGTGSAENSLTIRALGIINRSIGDNGGMLKDGPIWWPGVPGRPGQGQPMAIAGHDVTPVPGFGNHGPFYYLETLRKGELIEVRWQGQLYRYRITAVQILPEKDREMIRDLGFETLTLSTCWPRRSHQLRYLIRSVRVPIE